MSPSLSVTQITWDMGNQHLTEMKHKFNQIQSFPSQKLQINGIKWKSNKGFCLNDRYTGDACVMPPRRNRYMFLSEHKLDSFHSIIHQFEGREKNRQIK